MTPLLLTIPETATALSLSRTTVYELVRDGKLATVTVGRSRRVRVAALERFIDQHECYAGTRRRRK